MILALARGSCPGMPPRGHSEGIEMSRMGDRPWIEGETGIDDRK